MFTSTTTLNSFLLVFNQYQRHYIHHQQQLHHLISFYYCASPISKTFYSSSTTTTPFNFYYCVSPISTICSQQVFYNFRFVFHKHPSTSTTTFNSMNQSCLHKHVKFVMVYTNVPIVATCLFTWVPTMLLPIVCASFFNVLWRGVCLDLFKNWVSCFHFDFILIYFMNTY